MLRSKSTLFRKKKKTLTLGPSRVSPYSHLHSSWGNSVCWVLADYLMKGACLCQGLLEPTERAVRCSSSVSFAFFSICTYMVLTFKMMVKFCLWQKTE